jgi:hypothetical protein
MDYQAERKLIKRVELITQAVRMLMIARFEHPSPDELSEAQLIISKLKNDKLLDS